MQVRDLAVGLVLLCCAPLLCLASADARPLSLEDVVRLHTSGLSDDVIMSEMIVSDSEYFLSVDEIIRLKELGLSDRLLKFMIDTRLEDEGDDQTFAYESAEDWSDYGDDSDWDASEEGSARLWENVIVEEEPTTEYFATLSWSYPSWYYDTYWYDYWYYDYAYAPYRSSWCWSVGAWYPGWYSARNCWSSPYWAYSGWGWYGGSWGYYGCSSYAYSHGYYHGYHDGYHHGYHDHHHYHGYSDYKYKSNSGGSGKLYYAHAGLKVKNVDRLTKHAGVDIPIKKKKLLVADSQGEFDPNRRIGRPTRVGATSSLSDRPNRLGGTGGGTPVYGGIGRDPGKIGATKAPGELGDRPRKVTRRPSGAANGGSQLDRPVDTGGRKPTTVDRRPAPRPTRKPTKSVQSPTPVRDRQPTREEYVAPSPPRPKPNVSKPAPQKRPAPKVSKPAPQKRPAPKPAPRVQKSAPKPKPKVSKPAPQKRPAPKPAPRVQKSAPKPKPKAAKPAPRKSTSNNSRNQSKAKSRR